MVLTRHPILLLVAAFVPLAFSPLGRAQDKLYRPALDAKYLDSCLKTDWYGVYLQNKKIGYFRIERKRENGKIVEEQFTSLKIRSFDQKIELSQTQTQVFQGTAPYRLLSAKLVEKKGTVTETTAFTWNEAAGGYDQVHQVAGQERKELLKNIDFALADDVAPEVWVTKAPKVGDVIRWHSFDFSERKLDTLTSKILSSKESLVSGVRVHFYEVETESVVRQLKFTTRYDDQGNTLSSAVATLEQRKETEKQAKDTQYSQDLFVMGRVKIDRPIGRETRVAELVVEVSGMDPDVLEDGPRQRVITGGKSGHVLKLGKKHGKEIKATAEEIKEALAETNAYPIRHPKVKALADKVTAGATTDEQKVAKLVAFVHLFIEPHLAPNLPNVHELLEKKRGDCKAYALLFNNLARAAGVPAREVGGLVYSGDDVQAFDGHAWNEVVLNGVWVPVDASRGETEVNATHICFGPDHKATRSLLTSLGKLSFRLVEVKRAP